MEKEKEVKIQQKALQSDSFKRRGKKNKGEPQKSESTDWAIIAEKELEIRVNNRLQRHQLQICHF